MHAANSDFRLVSAFRVAGPFCTVTRSHDGISESRRLCPILLLVHAAEHPGAFDRFDTSVLKQMDNMSSQTQNLHQTRDLLLPRLLSEQINLATD